MELDKVPRGGIAREHLHEVVPFLDGLDFPVESDVVSADLGMHFGYALEIAAEVCAAAFKIVADYELEALLRIFHVAENVQVAAALLQRGYAKRRFAGLLDAHHIPVGGHVPLDAESGGHRIDFILDHPDLFTRNGRKRRERRRNRHDNIFQFHFSFPFLKVC